MSLPGIDEQDLLRAVEKGDVRRWDFHGLEILQMMSLGYEVRTAGSHLPPFRHFRGLCNEASGSLASQPQKEKSASVSGKGSILTLTQRRRVTDFVTVHKLFHLLPQHHGLINHGKLSRDSRMLNTNTGDPLIHGVVTRGREYSCLTMPVHSLSQQPCFISSSSEELSVCKVNGRRVGLAERPLYGGPVLLARDPGKLRTDAENTQHLRPRLKGLFPLILHV